MMKRYNPELVAGFPQVSLMRKSKNGAWVRYEDVKPIIDYYKTMDKLARQAYPMRFPEEIEE